MEASNLSDHISRRFNKDIEELRSSVLAMGGLVEAQLSRAIAAIVSGDSDLGLQVANDDYKVNRLEVGIDEECSRILATRAPAASDLRLIVAIIKTITDLERVGDEAEKIGFLASQLAAMDRPTDSYRELKYLGTHVLQMLRAAMTAFARLDAEAALEVVRELPTFPFSSASASSFSSSSFFFFLFHLSFFSFLLSFFFFFFLSFVSLVFTFLFSSPSFFSLTPLSPPVYLIPRFLYLSFLHILCYFLFLLHYTSLFLTLCLFDLS